MNAVSISEKKEVRDLKEGGEEYVRGFGKKKNKGDML